MLNKLDMFADSERTKMRESVVDNGFRPYLKKLYQNIVIAHTDAVKTTISNTVNGIFL